MGAGGGASGGLAVAELRLNGLLSLSACETSEAFGRDRLAKRFPAAESLSVYDGQTLLGFVLVCPRPLPAYGFDADQQRIGSFETRKAAVDAASTHGPRP